MNESERDSVQEVLNCFVTIIHSMYISVSCFSLLGQNADLADAAKEAM